MTEYIIKAADWAIDYNGNSLFRGTEEIVRCKDCMFLLEDERYNEATCRFYCRTLPKKGYRDGYCAWAQRKEQV